MARLLTKAAIRDPKPSPARPIRNAIQTHPTSAAGSTPLLAATPDSATPARRRSVAAPEPAPDREALALHDRLFAAWNAKDWDGIATTARSHLENAGPGAAPRLHPMSAAAMEFFRPWATTLTRADIELFVGGFDRGELREYLGGAWRDDRNRLADHALAYQCLGLLGEAEFDYVGGLRALTAFSAAAVYLSEEGKGPLSTGLIAELASAPVYLPAWSFEIDPCHGLDPVKRLGRTPLEAKLERLRRVGPLDDTACDCTPKEDLCTPQNPCCAEIRYYVAELLELRDWTHAYKAGDLAYVEIVAAGETRSRKHEMKRTKELFSETVTTERASDKRDLQVTDRSSLKREIDRQAESSTSAEASVNGKYKLGAYSAEISASGSFTRTASQAIREAQDTARETVKSAVSEIEKETRTTRSERITTEETEKNLHAFKNAGVVPLVTKYFYVTQVRRAQLYSYDKQLLAELIVPGPGRLYEHLVRQRREAQIAASVKPLKAVKPTPPADIGFEPEAINPGNYAQWSAQWGVTNPPAPPELAKQISVSLSDGDNRVDGEHVGDMNFQVPAGYWAVAMSLSGSEPEWRRPLKDPHKVVFNCAGETLFWSKEEASPKLWSPLGKLTDNQSIAVDAWYTDSFDAVVTIQLEIMPSVLSEWKSSVYQLLKDKHDALAAAYQQQLTAYEAIMAEYEDKKDKLRQELIAKEKTMHPFYKRELERAELKRAVIYLLCQDFSVDGAVIRRAEPCGFPEIDRGAAAAKGYDWYFWDRLIDWKRMAYAFFDYFWNPMCSWPERFDPDESDALFKAFLRAGYARVLVPINAAMHNDFLWYVSTRQKWGQTGEPPLNPGDPRWRNVVFELKHASESAMTEREGHVDVVNGALTVLIKGSDRYWDPTGAGSVDPLAVAGDIDRELFIDGTVYLITDIQLDPGSPPYDPLNPNSMWWRVSLDRAYEGPTATGRLYALGAQAVAPVFSFDMPTELIWAGAHDECLPQYPLPPCGQ